MMMMVVEILQERMLDGGGGGAGRQLVLRWRRGKHLADIAADERIVAADGKVLRRNRTAIGRLVESGGRRETGLRLLLLLLLGHRSHRCLAEFLLAIALRCGGGLCFFAARRTGSGDVAFRLQFVDHARVVVLTRMKR